MLDDAQMRACRLRGLQLDKTTIVGILLLAQKHQVAFCAIVSGVGSEWPEVLPLNVRRKPEPLVKWRAGVFKGRRCRRGRGERRMALCKKKGADAARR